RHGARNQVQKSAAMKSHGPFLDACCFGIPNGIFVHRTEATPRLSCIPVPLLMLWRKRIPCRRRPGEISTMPAPAAPTHVMVTRNDVRLEVLAQGDGPPIVLLPSLGRGAEDFNDIAASLAGAGYRVLRPQPRGIGASRGAWDGVKLEDLAADVA